MGNEELPDRCRIFCGDQQIEIVQNLLSSPIAPGDIDLRSVAVRRQIRTQRFRFSSDLPELKRTGMRCAFRDRVAEPLLRGLPKARQFSDTSVLARLLQLLDRTDPELIVETLNFFGAEARQ